MKRLVIVVAAVIIGDFASPADAQDGFAIDIDGHRVRVDVPRDCRDEHCVTITTGKVGRHGAPGDEQTIDGSRLLDMLSGLAGGRGGGDAPPRPSKQGRPGLQPAEPHDVPGPVAALPPPGMPAVPPPAAPTAPSTATPSGGAPSTATPGSRAPTAGQPVAAPAGPQPTPAPRIAAIPPAHPITPPPPAAAPQEPKSAAPASPIGLWLTEKGEGRIHIAPCGANLCGYAVEAEARRDGTRILIDMKPVRDGLWNGRVHDPRGGGTYDATMALKAPDRLGIRGCAMGGLICQGQTWTRG